jgi:hypothetical protein
MRVESHHVNAVKCEQHCAGTPLDKPVAGRKDQCRTGKTKDRYQWRLKPQSWIISSDVHDLTFHNPLRWVQGSDARADAVLHPNPAAHRITGKTLTPSMLSRRFRCHTFPVLPESGHFTHS